MILGVTGTKGKTTICSLLHHALLWCKKDVVSFTTLGTKKNNTDFPIEDPSLTDLSNVLNSTAENKVLEMTSYCLELSFFDFTEADCVIMTGIEEDEHTEIHHTFDRYIDAKRKIFGVRRPGAKALVCLDDDKFDDITRDVPDLLTYGFNKDSDCVVTVDRVSDRGMFLTLDHNGKVKVKTKLVGDHNALNVAACYLALTGLGLEKNQVVKALESFDGVPGRFEKFYVQRSSNRKTVIIDYAHTPRSLEVNLKLVRKIFRDKKLCTVFGCGGNKSSEKRPKMGEVAERLSDEVILTNDNPRRENPLEIISHILSGMTKPHQFELDRKSAIKMALEGDCDIVFLAGKGSEDYYIDSEGYHSNMSDKTLLTDVSLENNFVLKNL